MFLAFCQKKQKTAYVTWNVMLTFGSFECKAKTFLLFPLLSNLGHILCGRLGHTISVGFEGIWWTSGPSLNLNIWITERRVNMQLCLTFQILSLLKLNCPVSRVSSPPPHHLFNPSPALCCWNAHPENTYHIHTSSISLSQSFKMYIHTELNITVLHLLSVLLSLSHRHIYTPPTMFSCLLFLPLQCCHRHRFLWQQWV